MNADEKYIKLLDMLTEMKSVTIAFSGGVDSTFLVKAAKVALNDKVLEVTATSSTYPKRELNEAISFANDIGVRHEVISSEELDIEGFSKNPSNRCYYCKSELFTKIRAISDKQNMDFVLDGSNFDDIGDFRPGMQAACELNVISPLKEVKMTKADIRKISKKLNLPTWDKPAFACLSSRFPYGNEITSEKLSMVDKAEQFLLDLGFRQIRVRHHEDIARIEINPDEITKIFDVELMGKIYSRLSDIGFTYVTLDMRGYRQGSMNEVESIKKIIDK